MTITNDERREVAARLREHAKTARRVGYACVLKNCTSEEECDGFGIEGCEGCFNKSLARLADLIEPEPERTCRVLREMVDLDGERMTSYTCCFCQPGWGNNYCPNCGARVIDKEN